MKTKNYFMLPIFSFFKNLITSLVMACIVAEGAAVAEEKSAEEKLMEKLNTEIARVITGKQATTDARLDAIKAELDKITDVKGEKSIAAELVRLQTVVSTMKDMGFGNKKTDKSFWESLREGLEANKSDLGILKEKDAKAKSIAISFKAVGDMTIAGNISGGNVPVEQRLPGVNEITSRRIRLMDIVQRGTASSNVISWVYQSNKQGAAGETAEGVAKNQIDFDLVVASESVKKFTAYIKASTEMLDDIDFMMSIIRAELIRELLKVVEGQIYEGDGTGGSMNGVLTVSTAFSAGTFAATIDNANIVDVLVVAMDQIAIANQDAPTAVLMHPSDVTRLKLTKVSSTDKRYVDRLAQVGSTLLVDGVPIIPTTLVTVDKYLIGDFTKALVLDKGDVQIEIGLDGNDFTKNMRTIIAEWRGVTIVKNNDRTAFVTGDFSTDMAALETP